MKENKKSKKTFSIPSKFDDFYQFDHFYDSKTMMREYEALSKMIDPLDKSVTNYNSRDVEKYKDMLNMANEYDKFIVQPKTKSHIKSNYQYNWKAFDEETKIGRRNRVRDELIEEQLKKLKQLKEIVLAAFRGRIEYKVEEIAEDYEQILDFFEDLARYKPLSESSISKLNKIYKKYK